MTPLPEPAFKWRSISQEPPEDQSYVMVCFGVHVVEGSYDNGLWLSLVYGEAKPDFWAYYPQPPHHKDHHDLFGAPQLKAYGAAVAAEKDAMIEAQGIALKKLSQEVLALGKERDALRADAARYRWLREQDDHSPVFCVYGSNGAWGECGHSEIYGELLDTSIDEALKGTS